MRPLENARKQFLISEKIFYGLTAVLEFEASEARLAIKGPLIPDGPRLPGAIILLRPISQSEPRLSWPRIGRSGSASFV